MDLTAIIVAIITSNALAAGISCICSGWQQRKTRNKVDQILLLNALKQQGRQALSDGNITHEDLQALEEIYRAYKDMGGNGYAEALMAQCRQLRLE